MENLSYHVTTNLSYEEALEKVVAALKAEGFGVLTEIDVKATLKKKLDVDFRKYVILGACNPSVAHQALEANLGIGIFMPCNVVVYEIDGGQTALDFLNPGAMVMMKNNPALEPVAAEAEARIGRVVEAMRG
jgi:uncharacterized protein (DUF302 family)